MPIAPRVAPPRSAQSAHPLPLCALLLVVLVLTLAPLVGAAHPARAQTPPDTTSVYLRFASNFRITQPLAAGQLYCQGDNARGQLAHNPGWTPVRVGGLVP